MALVRNLTDTDVLDLFRTTAEHAAPRLCELMGGHVNWEDASAVRAFLRDNPLGRKTFADSASKDGGKGGVAIGKTFFTDADVDESSSDTRVNVSHSIKTNTHTDAYDMDVKQMRDLLKNVQRVEAELACKAAPGPTAATAALEAKLAHLATVVEGLAANAQTNGRAGLGASFAAFARGIRRAALDVNRIYPVLLPGTPVPTARLVGGGGWTSATSPPCGVCARFKPQITEWLNYTDVEAMIAADASCELCGPNGKPKLLPHQGFTHNPQKCVNLHRLVNEHIKSDPDAKWMLDEAA
jgi:hypothetical protein